MLHSRLFQATDVSWRLNLRLAQSSSHKVKAPNALFEINVASNGNNGNSAGVRPHQAPIPAPNGTCACFLCQQQFLLGHPIAHNPPQQPTTTTPRESD